MEFKNTLEIVTKDIQDIEKLVGNFKNYSKIPNIELDLALSRLRNVYELLLMFRNDTHAESQRPAAMDDALIAAPVAEVQTVERIIEEPEIEDVFIKTEPPVAEAKEDVSVSQAEAAPITDPEKNEIVPPVHEAHHKSGIKKKPETQQIYVHEKLGEHTHKKDVSSRLQNQAIKSISGSVGINDKFLFIRELFAGNAELFRQTMHELDDCRNFNDAYTILMERFQWDMDSETVQMLLNLIRRKFITSGNV
jgi:hypothetical protein